MKRDFIALLKDEVLELLKEEDVSVVLFGSRARSDESVLSDVDIGVIPKGHFNRTKLVLLREAVENMNIPYKIDIVDFSLVSKEFKEEALKKVEIWKD